MSHLLTTVAGILVVLVSVWLTGLAVAAFARPESVKTFFAKFASSALIHFLEMFLRLVVGMAFVVYASHMKFPMIFTVFGWIVIFTTAVLMFVPWRLHRRFADRSLPMVTSRMPLFGLASLSGGVMILISFILGAE